MAHLYVASACNVDETLDRSVVTIKRLKFEFDTSNGLWTGCATAIIQCDCS